MPDHDVRLRRRPPGGERGDVVERLVCQLGERTRLPVVEPALREERIEAALEAEPRPRPGHVEERRRELRSGWTTSSPSAGSPDADGRDEHDRLPVQLGRERLVRRDAPEERERAQLVRRLRHEVAPAGHDRLPASAGYMTAATITIGPTGCAWNSNDVTTPKLLPAPRTAQNRSSFSVALARRSCPSAVTMSTESRLSIERPCLRRRCRAAVQRQARDAGRRDDAARHGQPEELRLAVTVAPGRAALHAHLPARGSTWTPFIRERSITSRRR